MVCSGCKKDLPIHARGLCRKCYTKYWRKKNPDKQKQYRLNIGKDRLNKYAEKSRRKRGIKPYYKNKECNQYLGIHVAERILSKIYPNVKRMPFNNSGYDFICGQGYKVDVKAACKEKINPKYEGVRNPSWGFMIKNNTVADYFLCIGFDDLEKLNPQHIWMIPGYKVNHFNKLRITVPIIYKYGEYEQDIDDIVSCCNEMKK